MMTKENSSVLTGFQTKTTEKTHELGHTAKVTIEIPWIPIKIQNLDNKILYLVKQASLDWHVSFLTFEKHWVASVADWFVGQRLSAKCCTSMGDWTKLACIEFWLAFILWINLNCKKNIEKNTTNQNLVDFFTGKLFYAWYIVVSSIINQLNILMINEKLD